MLPAVESPARLLLRIPAGGPSCLHILLQHSSLVLRALEGQGQAFDLLGSPLLHPLLAAPEEVPTATALSKALAVPPWVTGVGGGFPSQDSVGRCPPLSLLTSTVLLDLALCLCYFTSARLDFTHPPCLPALSLQ